VIAAPLLLGLPLRAQVKFAGFSTDLNGIISTGYNADFGNQTGSDHNWTVGGSGNFSGSFYSPNFFSFNAAVFLNQSRANSDFQSISEASGVDFTSNIFGGSHFPGTMSFTKTINSEGNYAVPGLANYVTHGNSDTFGVNWGENIPDKPSLSVGFQLGDSKYSVYGTDDNGSSKFDSLSMHSAYSIDGLGLTAYFTGGKSHALIPEVVSGENDSETESGNEAYGFTASHRLPLSGSIAGSLSRSSYDSSYEGSTTNGTVDLLTASAILHPMEKLSLSASANYSDNLSGQLAQSVIAAGGAVSGLNSNESSGALDLQATAGYGFLPNLLTSTYVERRTQSFLGTDYAVDSFGLNASYGRKMLDGNLNASVNVSDNNSETAGENALGISSNVNYSTEFRGWKMNGTFGYAQDVQTLLVTYTSSGFNYSASAGRHWGNLLMSLSAGAGRTALTQDSGATSSSQSYSVGLGYSPWLTATGTYSKSSGEALATGAGLVTVPIPPPILPSGSVSLYGGSSYAFGLSSSPVKGLTISASYAKSTSDTTSASLYSANVNDEYNSFIQYQMRKLYFTSGYARLGQGFSGSDSQPAVVSSFYIGVSRWFNFF
jgi:hypothetical protein